MAKINFKNSYQNIPVSNIFINKYMPKANGSFVKVYLYGLLHSLMADSNITNKDIANALDMIESDVHNAWKYWETCGLIKLNSASDSFGLEFLDIKEIIENKALPISPSRPSYQPKELAIYINNNSEISYLYKMAGQVLGKDLSSNDASILFSFYDWLRLPVEVILMLLEYSASIDKRSMRYIEKVAIDWADKGFDDAQKVEKYLKDLESKNKNQFTVKKVFGIQDRDFISTEKSFFDKWINEYKLPIDVIKLACEQTIQNINKPSFAYADKILKDWYDNSIKTVNQAIAHMEEKYKKKSASNVPAPKDKFNNFTQRNTDYNKVIKMISEKKNKEGRSS